MGLRHKMEARRKGDNQPGPGLEILYRIVIAGLNGKDNVWDYYLTSTDAKAAADMLGYRFALVQVEKVWVRRVSQEVARSEILWDNRHHRERF